MTINIFQIRRAEEAAKELAREQIEDGQTEPLDDLLPDYVDRQDVINEATGEKIDPDSEDGWIIIDAFENAYYNEWEENENGETYRRLAA